MSNIVELGDQNWLVVSTPLKNMSSSMGLGLSHIMENNPVMFETTNQWLWTIINHY